MTDIVPTEADEEAVLDQRIARFYAKPSDHVAATIDWVCRWFDEKSGELERDGAWFRNAYIGACKKPDQYDADYFFLKASTAAAVDLGKDLMPFQITGIVACCAMAREADMAGDERVAWTYTTDARQLAMSMMQYWSLVFDDSEDLARRALYVRAQLARRAAVASAKLRTAAARDKHTEWVALARKLIEAGREPRNVATIVAGRTGHSARQVRTVLQRSGLVTSRKAKTKSKKEKLAPPASV